MDGKLLVLGGVCVASVAFEVNEASQVSSISVAAAALLRRVDGLYLFAFVCDVCLLRPCILLLCWLSTYIDRAGCFA